MVLLLSLLGMAVTVVAAAAIFLLGLLILGILGLIVHDENKNASVRLWVRCVKLSF